MKKNKSEFGFKVFFKLRKPSRHRDVPLVRSVTYTVPYLVLLSVMIFHVYYANFLIYTTSKLHRVATCLYIITAHKTLLGEFSPLYL